MQADDLRRPPVTRAVHVARAPHATPSPHRPATTTPTPPHNTAMATYTGLSTSEVDACREAFTQFDKDGRVDEIEHTYLT